MRQKRYIAYLLAAFALLPLVAVAQSGNRYYVTNPKVEKTNTPQDSNDGLSWAAPIPLETALQKAVAGDEIWVKGYSTPDSLSPYVTPTRAGFTLKSGVSLYGGFKGDETELSQRRTDGRAYRMSYRTVITGDINRNDSPPDVQYMIFPENTKRSDNAIHVLTLDLNPASGNNSNALPTVVNGITIIRGHATGTQPNGTDIPEPDKGGGIYVTCSATPSTSTPPAFHIEQCFFIGNYATEGGGLYVASSATNPGNIVNRCGFFNNAAGQRAGIGNHGGAIRLDGTGEVVNSVVFNNENGGLLLTHKDNQVVNTTITRNTGPAVDGAGKYVWNTVVWGNTSLSSASARPTFSHSALQEADTRAADAAGNVGLTDRNNETGGPHFSSPSLKIGFDRDFDVLTELYPVWTWDPTEATLLVDSGDDKAYDNTDYGTTDLGGHTRKQGTIDIGAYEFQPILSERIRYVKEGGEGNRSGTSWDNASGDLQKMIDELADNNSLGLPGEVWVAEGTYKPYTALSSDVLTSVTFRMRDGISVYGGFDKENPEDAKNGRKIKEGGMSWDYANPTVLEAADYAGNLSYNQYQYAWTLSSNSVHVVWFAPWGDNASAFVHTTTLDGVTIRGGHATGVAGMTLRTDCGAGVYMDGSNTRLTRCILTENYATANGGAIYLKDGVVENSLFYNNNATANGGAVYVENNGLVHRCMLTNNSALNGSAVYLDNTDPKGRDGSDHPEYLILSTCVVSNNTGRANGAIYCNRGGVVLQCTVTNNYCPMATDAAEKNASRTGGLYLNEYGVIVNSVLWNNRLGADKATATNIPFYALNPSGGKVNFYYNAISGENNALWNDILQVQTLKLLDDNAAQSDSHSNSGMGPRFSTGGAMATNVYLVNKIGVQSDWRKIDYYWEPLKGSNLWASGLSLDMMPDDVVLAPEIDLGGGLFAQKPAVGAFHVDKASIVPQLENGNTLVLYVNSACNNPDHDGHSWETAYRSLNDAILHFAGLGNGSTTDVYNGDKATTHTVDGSTSFIIRVHEGTLWPRYSFVNEDPKSASIILRRITAGNEKLRIEGGYRATGNTADRAPLDYRSIIDGNTEAASIDDGLYHVVTVESNANVELDGFHIINGNAANTATQQYGAGMLVYDNAEVALSNCIFENHTAVDGAAIYAPSTAKLTLTNCVVNNNTNQTETNPVIQAGTGTLTLNHVTVVNNKGAAPAGIGNAGTTSFAAGNSDGNSNTITIPTLGGTGEGELYGGQLHFANPTRVQGATLGFSTWLGGYSSFRPLTSSDKAGTSIINCASSTDMPETDITGGARDLGGLSDLGAYEADLPAAGRVYYVRTSADGGDDNHDGKSWSTAFATVRKAVETAYNDTKNVVKAERPQVWVAAGTYEQAPISSETSDKLEEGRILYPNCFDMRDGVNVYGGFPNTGNPGMNERHPLISTQIYCDNTLAKDYETILKPKESTDKQRVYRVLGQLDQYNPYKNPTNNYDYIEVGEGKGDYNIEFDEVKGGDYYYSETGEYVKASSDVATHILWNKGTGYWKYFAKFDIDDARKDVWNYLLYPYYDLIKVGTGFGDYDISQKGSGTKWDPYYYVYTEKTNGQYKQYNEGWHQVNPEEVTDYVYRKDGSYYPPASNETATYKWAAVGQYTYVGSGYGTHKSVSTGNKVEAGKGAHLIVSEDKFCYPTRWDGFTLTEGYINSAKIPYLHEYVGTDGNQGRRNGGAGAVLFENVTLANCIVSNNTNAEVEDNKKEIRGGGIYCDKGTIVNCYIMNNKTDATSVGFGGGAYLYNGTVYNCVIVGNHSSGKKTNGAAIFIENGEFYNNTIVGNVAEVGNVTEEDGRTGNGGMSVYKSTDGNVESRLIVYNCISVGNTGFKGLKGKADAAAENGIMKCYNSILGEIGEGEDYVGEKGGVEFDKTCNAMENIDDIFVDYASGNFRLKPTAAIAINKGKNEPEIDDKPISLFDYTDMDFTDRVKDCTVDIGAYELTNKNTEPNTTIAGKAIYYVTQNGKNTATGSNLENAACAQKLQTILYAAGEYKKEHPNTEVIVKVAGYPATESSNATFIDRASFVYHATTLADPDNPKSYSYIIPYGVVVEGGYSDQDKNWEDDTDGYKRDILTYKTVLSAIHEPTATTQAITGYHAVTFGEKPEGWTVGDAKSVIDGVWLTDGSATSMAGPGDPNTRGGGAIVEAWAHVRNCIVKGCEAIEGGGLYLKPGATVSGTAVLSNNAEKGGGIYAESEAGTYSDDGNGSGETDGSTDVNEGGSTGSSESTGSMSVRSHLISCTLADNNASNIGGGIYLEDGSVMSANCVIWGNTAPSDKNVSGVVKEQFEDQQWAKVFDISRQRQTAFYPFNSCFVESQEMPADFENTTMESDGKKYFVDTDRLEDYRLKEFSLLINRGTPKIYQTELETVFGVTPQDMQDIARKQDAAERLDAGAFAYEGGILPDVTKDVFTRLFVNPANEVKLAEGQKSIDFLGRSFYTPFATLNDALSYVKKVREADENGIYKNTQFEILMSGGIYKPSVLRDEFSADVTYNQRLYTFTVPYGVSIYGGFKGNEPYACEEMTTIPTADGNKSVEYGAIADLLNAREFSDFNNNGVEETWELSEQTILSGEINASAQSQNVYKIIYTNAPENSNASDFLPVRLDGLTIKDSETFNQLSGVEEENEAGRGGGVYSNGVGYVISRCRFLNNFAMRGGAVYVRNARLDLVGCTFTGNGTVKDAVIGENGLEPRGGAVYVADINNNDGDNTTASLYAVNCLFANNETAGEGGAIGTTYNDNKTGTGSTIPGGAYKTPTVNLMNCTLVRNKAKKNAVVYNKSGTDSSGKKTSHIVNTLVWGNESTEQDASTDLTNFDIRYSASDYDYGKSGDNGGFFAEGNKYHNIPLHNENMHMDGPHFTLPSEQAGVEGYTGNSLWNPIAVSMATDKGCGGMKVTYSGETVTKTEITDADNSGTLSYAKWFVDNNLEAYKAVYMPVHTDANTNGLPRYSGPLDETTGKQGDMPIDIGLYEYRYKTGFSTMLDIYVATEESGNGSGTDWANATSNLRDAIIGAAHPTQKDGSRTIYVRDGQYDLPRLSTTGTAFTLDMQNTDVSNQLTIKGSCTGNGATQDFSKQSVIRTHHQIIADRLLEVSIPEKKDGKSGNTVTVEGFTFISDKLNTESTQESGNGVEATIGTDGKFVMKNCIFRNNVGTGILIKSNGGKALFYNTLIADSNNGLNVGTPTGKTVLVNTTFANNKVALTNGDSNPEVDGSNVEVDDSNVEVYNSVWWNNGGQSDAFKVEGHNNKVFAGNYDLKTEQGKADAAANNTDIMDGPNFLDPLNSVVEARDYRFRPNLTLLNQGANEYYIKEVLNDGVTAGTEGGTGSDAEGGTENKLKTEIPDNEPALDNKPRLVDKTIDIGAYEYEAELQPIVYVKANVVGNTDGKSWTTALNDLQAAADLAGIYAHNKNTDDDIQSRNGYVFVHNNVANASLHLRLPHTKVYGGMNDEISTYTETDTEVKTKEIVKDLLTKRKGLLEADACSELSEVTLNAAETLADGFVIGTGTEPTVATIQKGMLATSVVEGNVTGTTGTGLLYNSLVKGSVSGVRAVNVTATGTIGGVTGTVEGLTSNAYNRTNASADNLYVTDGYWGYQLNETSADIDAAGTNAEATTACMAKVGHSRDIAGNMRVRNTVDNGCFETWDIKSDGTGTGSEGIVTQDDYPRGKSVVYVRENFELRLGEDAKYDISAPFNPGVLLLEHQAGLRGNGKAIALTNLVVERKVEAGQADMTYMPFTVSEVKNPYPVATGNDADAATATGVFIKYYDGNARAAYDYTFDSSNGEAWKPVPENSQYSNTGLLLDNTANGAGDNTGNAGTTGTRVRFYGKATGSVTGTAAAVYMENMETQSLRNVTLTKYNFNETWVSPDAGGNRFTHKENMSWNLFGSPYLCAMNYKDMEYGRVLYGLNGTLYRTVNTNGQTEGYIPAGDAVFTQTATLKTEERFCVAQPTTANPKAGEAYQAATDVLAIGVTRAAAGETAYTERTRSNTSTRTAGTISAENGNGSGNGNMRGLTDSAPADLLQLKAVPMTEARNDFDMATDGVKWMAVGEPQLYALRSGNRYSLLSAVDIEGALSIGVSVPESGVYTLVLPDGCDTYGYDAVVLEDVATGQTADLLEGSYDFSAPVAGDLGVRFTLRFQRPADEAESGIRAWSEARGELCVEGTASGDLLQLYSVSGTLLLQHTATSRREILMGCETGVVLVKVVRKGEKPVVCKVRVQ